MEWEKQLFYCAHRGFRVTGRDCDQYFQNGNGQQCPPDCQLRQKKEDDLNSSINKPNPAHNIVLTGDKTKTCKGCGHEKPVDEFPKNARAKDGHLNTCKICFGKKIKAGHAKTADKVKEKPSLRELPKIEPGPAKPLPDIPIQKHKASLEIDFSNYPDIYKNLIESAQCDFRTPDMQVVAILDKTFQTTGGES